MTCDTSCPRCSPWATIPNRAKCWHKPPSDATDATDGWIGVVMRKRCVFPKLYHTTPDSGQEPLFPKEER